MIRPELSLSLLSKLFPGTYRRQLGQYLKAHCEAKSYFGSFNRELRSKNKNDCRKDPHRHSLTAIGKLPIRSGGIGR